MRSAVQKLQCILKNFRDLDISGQKQEHKTETETYFSKR